MANQIQDGIFIPNRQCRIHQLESILKDGRSDYVILQILLSIENVQPTITEYRERERLLENLVNAITINTTSLIDETYLIIIGHLTSSLYVNFEKFWGPTLQKIIYIIDNCKIKQKIIDELLEHLKNTNNSIYDSELSTVDQEDPTDRLDHVLHRNFIFQILARFPQHVQKNSKPFVDEFFRFVYNELTVSPFIERVTRVCLIEEPEDKLYLTNHNGDSNLPESISSATSQSRTRKKKSTKQVPKDIVQKRKSRETFITASKVIQSIEHIATFHRKDELKELITELLCCRDSSVQRAAFNCLLVYERDKLQPYIERLLKILGDKTARTAITMLSADQDQSCMIQEADRPNVMPVMLRIVFGKMIGKIGKKSAGRGKADLRKNIVMRFIACCELDEIELFFQLLYNPLCKYIATPYDKLKSTVLSELDYKKFVPLNKMQAMISSLTSYMNLVANLKPETLCQVLKLICTVAVHVLAPLEDKLVMEKLSTRNIQTLKELRRNCITSITQFFEDFEYYNFHDHEVNFIFDNLVWPSTFGFIDRNHSVITPVFRFAQILASNQTYHKLLLLPNSSSVGETLIKNLIDLYSNEKTTRPILRELAKVFANLIEPNRDIQEDESQSEACPQTNHKLLESWNPEPPGYDESLYDIPDNLPLGTRMLVGYIPQIIERLNRLCGDFITKKSSEDAFEADELLILSMLSKLLKNSEQCILGARLLLASSVHLKRSELVIDTLRAARSLMQHVEATTDPNLIPLLSEILSYQRDASQRQELCNLLESISRVDQELIPVTKIIILMNRTSEELVGTPDIAKWNEGFHDAFSYLDNMVDSNLSPLARRNSVTLLLHQACFIINSVDRYEFSIRDNCLTFHEKLAKSIHSISNSDGNLVHYVIDELILEKFIKKGLRETNEVIRHSYLGVLRSWAIHCRDHSRVLKEFHLFCSDQDDLDFWINIRHIQLHNRSRALARLIANENLHTVSPKTLSAYFLPIASGFLFTKTYKSVSSLADNSIKIIGIICRQLNWVTYESTLGYYLDLLIKSKTIYQKTCIKLITEILKNFNFDLSACDEAIKNYEENLKLEKRMRKRIKTLEEARDDEQDVVINDAPCGKKLNPSTSRMVYNSVINRLIPRLSSCLHEMTRVEFEHDKNMSNYLPEKEEIKRIPMAYAIVQLLNLMPNKYLLFRDHLPVIILKLTSFLRSKNEQIRKIARMILVKVMAFVGPAYVPELVRILRQNLDKGFYIHVLNYTIHSVLEKMTLFYGCLDHSIYELVNLCFQEIFGTISEDKDIAQVIAKTSEAKKTKSYDTLLIITSYVSSQKLDIIMTCIKKELLVANESKKVSKLSNCINKIFTGLSKNVDFPLADILTFIEASIEESIPSLKIRPIEEKADSKAADGVSLRDDRYLIRKDLPRDRVKSRINEKGNLHMVVENSLRLLLHVFERNKSVLSGNSTYETRLNKFINLLTTCLKSSSPKCIMRSLKCIHFIGHFNAQLPFFEKKSNLIIKKIFILLSLYNGVGMVQGENSEMIAMCFKTLTYLLLKCKNAKLESAQLTALITYIEQDLNDSNRQVSAFTSLSSILQKRINCKELEEVMRRVSVMLVTSEDESIRKFSIKLWRTYLLHYKHEGKLLQVHLSRFLRQLDYEHIDGRKAVIQMISIVANKFPVSILSNYFELMFHLLSQRLVNEESKEVRRMVGQLIGVIIQRLPDKQTYLLNKFVLVWSVNSDTPIKLLGIKLLSVFVESAPQVLKTDKNMVRKTLSAVTEGLSQIDSTDVVIKKVDPESSQEGESLRVVKMNDKLKYHSIRLFRRLLLNKILGPVDQRFIDDLKIIWTVTTKRLADWYTPTVITCIQVYLIFIKETELSEALKCDSTESDSYLQRNSSRIVRTLVDRYIELLERPTRDKLEPDVEKKLLALIVESLVLIGRIVTNSKATLEFEEAYLKSVGGSKPDGKLALATILAGSDIPASGFLVNHLPHSIVEAKKHVNLYWLTTKIIMQARKEAALFRLKKSYRRDLVLKWMAVVAQELGPRRIHMYATLFMMVPVRELTDKLKGRSDDPANRRNIVAISEDLLKFIKSLIGNDQQFGQLFSKVQLHYTKRRVERKKKEAIVKVKHQARGVKRKMKESRNKVARRKLFRNEKTVMN